MTINFDTPLDQVETTQPEVMPIGEYLGFIEEAEEMTSKSGNEMIKLQVRLKGNESYDKRVLFHYLVFGLDHSLEAAKRLMVALRQDISGVSQIKAENLVGLRCIIKNKHEEYEGKMSDKIHYFFDMLPEESGKEAVNTDDEITLDDSEIPF